MIKKLICLLIFCSSAFAFDMSGGGTQIIQVNTHFKSVIGKPTWLLIVRDMQTGQVLPYMFDIKKNDNFWIAFTGGRSYRITASNLKFGPCAKINNFCNLENGVISGKSFWVVLSGDLSPDRRTFKCHVTKYNNNLPFPMNNNQQNK